MVSAGKGVSQKFAFAPQQGGSPAAGFEADAPDPLVAQGPKNPVYVGLIGDPFRLALVWEKKVAVT